MIGMKIKSYLSGPLHHSFWEETLRCKDRLWMWYFLMALRRKGNRRKAMPWQYLIYFLHFGSDR